jgi:two-component system NtrC family sensor kinase
VQGIRRLWASFVRFEAKSSPLTIIVIYLALAGAWILFADRLFGVFRHRPDDVLGDPYKEVLFAVLSAILLYGLISRLMRRLRRSEAGLKARVSELSCLYGMAREFERTDSTLEEMLHGVVQLLPPACLESAQAHARVELDGQAFETHGFSRGHQVRSADITIGRVRRGSVSISYVAKHHGSLHADAARDDARFLETVARDVGLIVERRESRASQQQLQTQLAHADRLASVGMMAASVAHEVNNPLTTINVLIQTLRDSTPPEDEGHKDLDIVLAEIDKIRALVLRFLQFARPGEPEFGPVELDDIVSRVVKLVRPQAGIKDVAIREHYAAGVGPLEADSAQLGQVVLNILLNAIDATPRSGEIEVSTEAPGPEQVTLKIWNSGEALPADLQEQIFEPFYTTKANGTGLGLPIAAAIVEKHRGRIWAVGHQVGGTSLFVKLPRGTEG